MRFGVLEIDPARNPAVLDTATWDPAGAAERLARPDAAYWERLRAAPANGLPLPACGGLVPHAASSARLNGHVVILVSLDDGQHVLVALGGDEPLWGEPLLSRPLAAGTRVAAYPADASTIQRFICATGAEAEAGECTCWAHLLFRHYRPSRKRFNKVCSSSVSSWLKQDQGA